MWSCETRDSVDAQHFADLFEGKALVIVQRRRCSPARAALDGGREAAFISLRSASWDGSGLGVLEGIDEGTGPVRAAVARLVQGHDGGVGDLLQDWGNSATPMPSPLAISWSVGARWSLFSRLAHAFSILRALLRTERGTQSRERSSSMMEPLMREIAYVSNLISRVGVERSRAPISREGRS